MLKKILKIKLKVIASLIIGLILIQVVTAYFFGVMAEKQLDLQFKHLTNSPFVTVVKHEYKRGWFSSDENVVLAINNQFIKNMVAILPIDDESAYTISYSTHVTNGIFAGWLHGSIYPTISYATTQLILPEKLNKILDKFFDGKPALNINNIILLNKSGKYLISSPSFNYDEALSGVKVNWGGLELKIGYDNTFSNFENDLRIPLFDLLAPTKGEFGFTDFTYGSNFTTSTNQIKVGATEMHLGALKVQLVESGLTQFKLGEAIHVLTGINSAEFLNDIDAINPARFAIINVNYNALSREQNNLFSATAQANFESLDSNNSHYGPMEFDLNIDHIDAPAFSKLADVLNTLANEDQTSENNRDKSIVLLKATMLPILVDSPVITLNNFSLHTPTGIISLVGSATTHNFESADMNDQDSFMKKLVLKVDFNIPKPVLAYLFVLQMKYFLTAGHAQMDEQSSEALVKVVNILLDNQLQVWLKKGYLKESNTQLSSKLTIESGVVSLNGIATK